VPAESGVAVVGAGVAGLAAAAALGEDTPVTVFDRLPAVGGVLGYQHPLVRQLESRCRSLSVRFALATTTLRWEGGRLLAAGPDGVAWRRWDRLLYAGGTRPSTAAELGIAGSRLAGVLPATVALHLLEAKVVLGRHVVLLGSGWWANAVAGELRHQGVEVTSVVREDAEPIETADQVLEGWEAVSADGLGRVDTLSLARGEQTLEVACDAVVLADGLRPLRNVDGAVFPGDPAVEFIQPVGSQIRAEEVATLAGQAAAALRDHPGDPS
jgi:NADPH-dependent glutamate synthase beta subunit-like oxidoreductase